MEVPAIPASEPQRLVDLKRSQLLDSAPEPRFDQYTLFASKLFNVPISLVSLVDSERQWFKSRVGLSATETHRDLSFCGHAIHDEHPLVVQDATIDPRFADNPLVTGEPHVIFYAGKSIFGKSGQRLGTLCLIDHQPRTISDQETNGLLSLAKLISAESQSSLGALWDDDFEVTNYRGFKLFCDIGSTAVDDQQSAHQLVEIHLPRNADAYSTGEKRSLMAAIRSRLENHALLGMWERDRLLAYYCDDTCSDNLEPLTFTQEVTDGAASSRDITFQLVGWDRIRS